MNKVLIVDDELIARVHTSHIFAELDISADLADSGEQALELARQQSYSLIMLDLVMPGISGFKTAELLLRLPTDYRPNAIVALTSNAGSQFKRMAQHAGMIDYLLKPLQLDQAQHLTQRFLDFTPGQGC